MRSKPLICLNCASPLEKGAKYCENCGQSTKYRNLSIKYVFASFFETFFNLDSKLIHSFKDIWKPNAITTSFIAGKRNYYVHPFRFYFVCLIVFFGLVSISLSNLDVGSNGKIETVSKFDIYTMIDTFSLDSQLQCEQTILDSLKSNIPEDIKNVKSDTFINATIFGSDLDSYGISTYDALTLDNKSLEEKYNVNRKVDKMVIHQFRHLLKDQETFIRKGIANLLWGILLLTALIALLLKLLYFRHSSYYIEHLLHVSNFHSMILLLGSMAMILNLIWPFSFFENAISIIILYGLLYFIISLKKYYNQGIFITLFKIAILGMGYVFSLTLIIVIIAIFTFIFA